MNKLAIVLLSILSTSVLANAVTMNSVTEKDVGDSIGKITISETKHGIVFTPDLQGLPTGVHGFHLHENASCEPKEKDGKLVAAGAAGAHFDPAARKAHGAPWGDGHLGDLPALTVDSKGAASQPVLAPRLKLSDLKGKALMIHSGGDNYSDQPTTLGGGGARIACGLINK